MKSILAFCTALSLSLLAVSAQDSASPEAFLGGPDNPIPAPVPDASEAPFAPPADFIPIHQLELLAHPDPSPAARSPRAVVHSTLVPRAPGVGPQRRVLGWHPYWATDDDVLAYQYSNLTHLAYFSAEVSPAGSISSLHSWNTDLAVEFAHEYGVKVLLTATLFGEASNHALLTNSAACASLVSSLLSAVTNRGGDGICIDFESVGSWSGATRALTAFMSNLTVAAHACSPALEVSIALPSVDWYTDFDVAAYERFGLDYAIIMGYDYYSAGSSTPGPVAPLFSSAQWIGASSWCSVDYSTRYYLDRMTNSDHLLLAVPYYGRSWRAASQSLGAASSGSAYSAAVTYPSALSAASDHGRRWNASASVPYYSYSASSNAYQCFYDDDESLALKYDYAISSDLGGVGIWCLSHAPASPELWSLLDDKFSSLPPRPSSLASSLSDPRLSLRAAGVNPDSVYLSWSPAASNAYLLQSSPYPSFADLSDLGSWQPASLLLSNDFSDAEGWLTNSVARDATATVSRPDGLWTLSGLEMRPALNSYGNRGYVYLTYSNSFIQTPPVSGLVTQAVLRIRAAGSSNLSGRRVRLLASTDLGESWTSLQTYAANSYTSILVCAQGFSLSSPSGVVFRCQNVTTNSSGTTVLLHDFSVKVASSNWVDSAAALADAVSEPAAFVSPLPASTNYFRVRTLGSPVWSEPAVVPAAMIPGVPAASDISSSSMTLSWSPAPGAAAYRVDVASGPFTNWTSSCPETSLGTNAFLPGHAWCYSGSVSRASTSTNLARGPGYCFTPTMRGHYLVGTNDQSLLSADFPLYGASSATLSFSNCAWNAAKSRIGIECTRLLVHYRVDAGPWILLGSCCAPSTNDNDWAAQSFSLPLGALDAESVAFRISAPDAEFYNTIRGAGLSDIKVSFSGPAGRYAPGNRPAGFPLTVTAPSASLSGLSPSTRYFFRVQALSSSSARSLWSEASASTAAPPAPPASDDPEPEPPSNPASQPSGALSGVVVYTSAGHGFAANSSTNAWITGRGLANAVNEDMGNIDQLNYFALQAWNAGATVVPMRPLGHQTNEVVLDNTSPSVSFGGAWSDSSQTDFFFGSLGSVPYRYASACSTGTSAWAAFRPLIPEPGEYPVYVWARHGSDRVSQLYRVHHRGGVTDVRVDHSQVGNGWVWIGNYFFDAGTNGFVLVSNFAPGASDPSSIVVADAVRFGNGMGDISRGSAGRSGYPRELEASRYWVQRMVLDSVGHPSTIYDSTGIDSDDNVSAPSRMALAMCRTNGWARWRRIYIGFHSNASGGSGTTRGCVGLYDTRIGSSSEFYKSQTNLARCIGLATVSNMTLAGSRGLCPAWSNNCGTILGGTYGEIYNADVFRVMDTTIDEVAFHDNSADALILRSPVGREWLARSALRGVVRHLANYYPASAVSEVFAPDAPSTLVATNDGSASVHLSWKMPAPAARLGGAPDGFVVYSSPDGLAFGDPIRISDPYASSLAIPLPDARPRFFRVAAFNAGGESLPSPVAGAAPSASPVADVLVVDGYKRNHDSQTPTRYFANNLRGDVSLVRPRMINAFDYVKEHGAAIAAAGRSFDSADADAVSASLLARYPKVVWILGEESSADESFSSAEQAIVSDYLAHGGCLFLSGSEIAYDLSSQGSGTDKAFLTNVLHAAYVSDDSAASSVTASASSIFSGISLEFNRSGLRDDIYSANYPDVIAPVNGSVSAAVYGTSSSGSSVAAIAFSNASSRIVFLAFPFETILSPSARNALMARSLDFFDDAASAPVWASIPLQNIAVGSDLLLDLRDFIASASPAPAFALLSASADPDDFSFDGSSFYFIPSAPGSYSFVFSASNASGSASATLSVSVGNAPVWAPIPDQAVSRGIWLDLDLRAFVAGSPAPAISLLSTTASSGNYQFLNDHLTLYSDTNLSVSFSFAAENASGRDTVSFSVSVSRLDSNENGIPDDWENDYFGSPTGADAYDDPDGDGATNLQEYLAGTDPTDPSSLLRIDDALLDESSGEFILSWPSVPHRVYSLWSATSILGPFSVLSNAIPADPPANLILLPVPSNPATFFQIRTAPPED